ncbi:hypothetical protein [Ruminococcus sp.]|uniref:hypothetical protein n=2 Tax=Ruminococcus sp. TaxID=41978 RepID=UPI0025D988EC|nr:hypothetical protein [Ruminococcus sp.]MCI5816467.1 hypothetical protein [Ruminococcus sp.]
MAYSVMARKFLQFKEEKSVERMEICVDAASDLPTVNSIPGCKIAQGSIAWDVSTGDFYGMASTGEWIIQSGGSVAASAASTLSLRNTAADTVSLMPLHGTTIEAEEDAYALGDIESGQDE